MTTTPMRIPEHFTPIREVKTTHGSISGTFIFNGEPVNFESTLERDFLIRLSTYDYILNVVSQPLTVKFNAKSNERKYNYTPDYLVHFKGFPYPYRKSELIEVKPQFQLVKNLKKWKPKFKAAIRCCKELNYVFHIKDEIRIRDNRWKNAMFLRRYQRMKFDESESSWIVRNLKQAGLMNFDYILKRHFLSKDSQAHGISHIWHLLSKKRIVCDLSEPLTKHTELWVQDDE